MKVATAGQYFRVTNGGGPMNSNDALIAWARKDMQSKADVLRKKREVLKQFAELADTVSKLFNNRRKPMTQWHKKWVVQDLKAVILWKQGPYPVAPYDQKLSGLSKGELQKLYEDTYELLQDPMPEAASWTDALQQELDRLESGEIEDFFVETGLQRAMDRDQEEIAMRLISVPSSRRKSAIIKAAFRSLPKQGQQNLAVELYLLIYYDAVDPQLASNGAAIPLNETHSFDDSSDDEF